MQSLFHKSALLVLCALPSAEGLRAETLASGTTYQLYGTLDSGIFYTRTSTSIEGKSRNTELQTSGQDDTRWGLRGRETLDGGHFVQLTLEAGFDSDTGAGGEGFNLQSWLGIGHENWGEWRLGRQATVGQEFVADLAIGNWKDFGMDALLRAADSMTTATHIRWHSPTWQGWQVGMNYQPERQQEGYGAALRYEYESWQLAVSIERGARVASLDGVRPQAWQLGLRHEGDSIHVAIAWSQTRNGFVARNGGGAKEGALADLGPLELVQGGRLQALYAAAGLPVGRGEWQVQWALARPRWQWQETGAAARNIQILSAGYLYTLSARTSMYAFAAAGRNYDFDSVANAHNPRSARLGLGLVHHF